MPVGCCLVALQVEAPPKSQPNRRRWSDCQASLYLPSNYRSIPHRSDRARFRTLYRRQNRDAYLGSISSRFCDASC